jgi:hypothetical protein
VKQIRGRLTYANVMSSIAVFLILGGATAFAATKIGAGQLKANSVKTGKIVKEAVTEGKIKNGAVTTSKIANDAVTGDKVKESSLGQVPSAATATTATTAGNANQLGGVGPGGYQHTLRWAVVEANAGGAKVIRGNATGATRLGSGTYNVSFAADIRQCAYVATLGDIGAGAGEPGEISVEQRSSTNPTDVEVRTYDSEGDEEDPASTGFHIAVICP